ncbi:hypothetical protein C9Z51_21625 [Escherichia coli]|nr:hypothetical protein C9Z51_21625 [Escherichia coli]TJT22878.1 hypothetical protein C9Z07_18020 [Escherichia coli]
MVNPPKRRGISAQVFLLYHFCAGSGADTEFTGRHPAPCSIQKLGIHPGSSSQEPFYMQKKPLLGRAAGKKKQYEQLINDGNNTLE